MNIRLAEQTMRARHQLPDEFTFFSWQCFPKLAAETIYVELQGGFPPAFKVGPKRGKPNWKKMPRDTCRTFVVTTHEYETLIVPEYIERTGNCPHCLGSKEELARWSATDGVTMRECGKCKGTGKAETRTAAAMTC